MQSDIPADQLDRAQARVEQLLEALRRQSRQLPSETDSALTFHPDAEKPE